MKTFIDCPTGRRALRSEISWLLSNKQSFTLRYTSGAWTLHMHPKDPA